MLPKLANKKIVAFDPGETTGVCVVDHGPAFACPAYSFTLTVSELLDRITELDAGGHFNGADAFVVENFLIYPGKAMSLSYNGMIAIQVIGMLRVWAKKLDIPIVLQSASKAKGFATDAKLQEAGWLHPRLHQRDAARHAYYYLATLAQKEQAPCRK